MKIVDAADVQQRPRKAPATRMIEQIPKGMLTTRQVAERFGVNIETIRRLARAVDDEGKPKFKAPSKAAQSGELIIWIYTAADVAELAEYFGERKKPTKRGRTTK